MRGWCAGGASAGAAGPVRRVGGHDATLLAEARAVGTTPLWVTVVIGIVGAHLPLGTGATGDATAGDGVFTSTLVAETHVQLVLPTDAPPINEDEIYASWLRLELHRRLQAQAQVAGVVIACARHLRARICTVRSHVQERVEGGPFGGNADLGSLLATIGVSKDGFGRARAPTATRVPPLGVGAAPAVDPVSNAGGLVASTSSLLEGTLAFYAGEAHAAIVIVTTPVDALRRLSLYFFADGAVATVVVISAAIDTGILFANIPRPAAGVITTAKGATFFDTNRAIVAAIVITAAEDTRVGVADLAITAVAVTATVTALTFDAELTLGASAPIFDLTAPSGTETISATELPRTALIVGLTALTTGTFDTAQAVVAGDVFITVGNERFGTGPQGTRQPKIARIVTPVSVDEKVVDRARGGLELHPRGQPNGVVITGHLFAVGARVSAYMEDGVVGRPLQAHADRRVPLDPQAESAIWAARIETTARAISGRRTSGGTGHDAPEAIRLHLIAGVSARVGGILTDSVAADLTLTAVLVAPAARGLLSDTPAGADVGTGVTLFAARRRQADIRCIATLAITALLVALARGKALTIDGVLIVTAFLWSTAIETRLKPLEVTVFGTDVPPNTSEVPGVQLRIHSRLFLTARDALLEFRTRNAADDGPAGVRTVSRWRTLALTVGHDLDPLTGGSALVVVGVAVSATDRREDAGAGARAALSIITTPLSGGTVGVSATEIGLVGHAPTGADRVAILAFAAGRRQTHLFGVTRGAVTALVVAKASGHAPVFDANLTLRAPLAATLTDTFDAALAAVTVLVSTAISARPITGALVERFDVAHAGADDRALNALECALSVLIGHAAWHTILGKVRPDHFWITQSTQRRAHLRASWGARLFTGLDALALEAVCGAQRVLGLGTIIVAPTLDRRLFADADRPKFLALG